MVEVGEYIKWGIVGAVAIVGIYIVYGFAKSQGWITGARTRRMRVQQMLARR